MTIKELKENGTLDILGVGGNNFNVADIDDSENDLGYDDDDMCNNTIDLYEIDHIGVSDEDNSIPTIFVKVPDFAKPGFRDICEHIALVGNTFTVRNMIHKYIHHIMISCNCAVFAYCTPHYPTHIIVYIRRTSGKEALYDVLIKHEHHDKLFNIDINLSEHEPMCAWNPAPGTEWCDNRYRLTANELLDAYIDYDSSRASDSESSASFGAYQTYHGVHFKCRPEILFSGCPRLTSYHCENYSDNIAGWVGVLHKE